MQPFSKLKATAAPLNMKNVDTDAIIPKQFLRSIKRTGFGINLFNDLRYDESGNEIPDFILNKPPYQNAQILIAGENFGCGSSREHAPWALLDFGIRCIIAPSFADIFYNNCFKNGILPIQVDQDNVNTLMQTAENKEEIEVDLTNQMITFPQGNIHFEIDSFRKKCLLEGLDDIALTLDKESAIDNYETERSKTHPWLWSE
jgi:3-isopropylmalate/(R)-2-methylmalate dehydratase small subunit